MKMPPWFKPWFDRLSSMSLAIALLVVLALASVIGTVLLQNQEQADYLRQFGPLWYSVFRVLGLFDMYHTPWFIGLLGFLMVSLAVCLWRHTPRMLREMKKRKLTIEDKSLDRFRHLKRWTLKDASLEQARAVAEKALGDWEVKSGEKDGRIYIRADKGRFNKWGYILVHSAILVILVGGWIGKEYGFRGTMNVVEGSAENEIGFVQGTGVGHLTMPFSVRCDKFFIDFYPTGMPKTFRSTISILDHGKVAVDHHSIEVNKPLYYKGVRIYQASFGDGGSAITLKLFRMDTGQVEEVKTRVYDTWRDPKTGVTLEIANFRPFNIENMANPGEPKQFMDLGPAVDFIIRGPGLKPVKVRSFMRPFVMNGEDRGNMIMVSMSGEDADFQPYALGLDFTRPKDWELYKAFAEALRHKQGANTQEANFRAFRAAMRRVFGDERPKNFQQMGARVIQAMGNLPQLPWPFIPVLEDYDQVYYTGLELARDPGQNIVWIGSAMLVIGLCIMFYMPHRKLWVVLDEQEGGVRARMGGITTRNKLGFEREFHQLFMKLDEAFAEISSREVNA